jgi:hypothetical protein
MLYLQGHPLDVHSNLPLEDARTRSIICMVYGSAHICPVIDNPTTQNVLNPWLALWYVKHIHSSRSLYMGKNTAQEYQALTL